MDAPAQVLPAKNEGEAAVWWTESDLANDNCN